MIIFTTGFNAAFIATDSSKHFLRSATLFTTIRWQRGQWVNSQTLADFLSGGMAWAVAHTSRKEEAWPIEQSRERFFKNLQLYE